MSKQDGNKPVVDFHSDRAKGFAGSVVNYREFMMMYTCALKEIQTKFDILNMEFKIRSQRNPISSITTRLKQTSSISRKLEKLEKEFTIKNIEENINDVAGIRVICAYVDDVYLVAQALLKQDDIVLIAKKDYIETPKPNGYRSLHLIVEVPVFFAESKRNVRVEVQLRTVAMDYWASLEHQLRYKNDVPDQERIVNDLTECAAVIHSIERRMLEIRNEIEDSRDELTEDEILFQKLSKLDISVN
ncbi:MAG: GTP pyrophosphokinase family protein [Clostridia bacterium]|nr:GTP pyrophosphokinase family protein [Clostridia bacterium]